MGMPGGRSRNPGPSLATSALTWGEGNLPPLPVPKLSSCPPSALSCHKDGLNSSLSSPSPSNLLAFREEGTRKGERVSGALSWRELEPRHRPCANKRWAFIPQEGGKGRTCGWKLDREREACPHRLSLRGRSITFASFTQHEPSPKRSHGSADE